MILFHLIGCWVAFVSLLCMIGASRAARDSLARRGDTQTRILAGIVWLTTAAQVALLLWHAYEAFMLGLTWFWLRVIVP